MTKHFVEFYYPGSFVSETDVKEIKNRNQNIERPKNCFGYRFFDKEVITKNGEVLEGKKKNISNMTYFGQKYSLKEVKNQFPYLKILISNMECNEWNYVVKTIQGNWQPLKDDDKVIEL
jgi:hypothetical protein